MRLDTAKIRAALWKSGKTQTSIAKEMHSSRVTISAVFNGKSCSPMVAEKIAIALDMPLESLLEDKAQ